MRRIWMPTLIGVTMAVMFWQVPFYETSPAANMAAAVPCDIQDPGCLPESVLFNPQLTTEIYARRFCVTEEALTPWKCRDRSGVSASKCAAAK